MSGDCLRTLDEQRVVLDVAFALTGESMLLAPFAESVEMLSMRTGERLASLNHGGATATSVTLSPCGLTALTLADDGVIRAWSAVTGECVLALEADAMVRSVCFATCEGEVAIATGSEGGDLRMWSLSSGRLLREARSHAGAIRALVCIPEVTL